ncbi:hypothetical protein L228DRAFT_250947 [Xylona heveae TC161]|uniref:DH domain-containing protein n=1 Tax=Xylona heveae (strain CBS 132557 / TC161) TaxID=1328760 RepID=A0A164ZPY1_XYLHT|nr:hypothetical protein L228DRAFT_250947 [Xylona heveae TC161]KZF19357.1 hypothetical protein L228DRAFT_250947 [Xylona heveae TC161]
MVVLTRPPGALSPDTLTAYYTTEPLLSNSPVLVLYGPATSANATLNTSHIQAHVFTAAGLRSYPRLTVSPNSPLYASVHHLPRDQQGDEVCRGLAVSLARYFRDTPQPVKHAWLSSLSSGNESIGRTLFREAHIGELASRLEKVEDTLTVIEEVQAALAEQFLSWIDVDLVLPAGSIAERASTAEEAQDVDLPGDENNTQERYGQCGPLVSLFGSPAFLPTSKMRRAPSKPTAIGRSKSLLKNQKEALRREMCELVDTEERYVSKVYDLLVNVADDFRQKARNKSAVSTSPNEKALADLFPPSLDEIFELNNGFLEAIRISLDETAVGAVEDMQTDTTETPASEAARHSRDHDPTGTLAFSKLLLEWFPKFRACYSDYMRASTKFPVILSGFTKDVGSSFSKRVQQTGEQRLRSLLIEPVQRLPRYSLFIDNMTTLLPATHPALKRLLKARDIITDICSLESSSTDEQSQVVSRLRNLISSWPPSLQPRGRLITAADYTEIPAPFRYDVAADDQEAGLFLLFSSCLVLVRKANESAISARGVLAEADRPTTVTIAASVAAAIDEKRSSPDLVFAGSIGLDALRFTETSDGRCVWMRCAPLSMESSALKWNHLPRGTADVRLFRLSGSYEDRVARWSEDFVKARIEGRFTEAERENRKWGFRSLKDPAAGLSMCTAVFEQRSTRTKANLSLPASITLIVNNPREAETARSGMNHSEIVASVMIREDGLCDLEITGADDSYSFETVSPDGFMPAFTRRVENFLLEANTIGNPSLTPFLLSFHNRILDNLTIIFEGDQYRPRLFRPTSPVKMLSNFLGGGSVRENLSTSRAGLPSSLMMTSTTKLPPPRPPSRVNSHRKAYSEDTGTKITMVQTSNAEESTDPVQNLEDTLATYVLALHCRKGNVVGKVLRNRAAADELEVNEIYNSLLEDPTRHQQAAEVSVDVLFSAFEKFLTVAWKERFGAVMERSTWSSLQDKSETLLPKDFAAYFKEKLSELAPQNQRAFKLIIRLFADLLDGAGNDGDCGALTATFAEVLVPDGNAYEYITLLDRLGEDVEILYSDNISSADKDGSISGSMDSARRMKSGQIGSVGSDTSLRKRFGFGTLTRERSKSEAEPKGNSVWRNLGKTSRGAAAGSVPSSPSPTKNPLSRSKSSDLDGRMTISGRPSSRDRPNLFSAFSFDGRPGSSSTNASLEMIGEGVAADHQSPKYRRKRRSSLSDLRSLHGSDTSPVWSESKETTPLKRSTDSIRNRPLSHTGALDFRFDMPKELVAQDRKENTSALPGLPPQDQTVGRGRGYSSPVKTTLTERAHNIGSEDATASPSPRGLRKRHDTISGIPTLKGTYRDRANTRTSIVAQTMTPKKLPTSPQQRPSSSPQKVPASPSRPPLPHQKSSSSSPQKLRMQSPQKLRERLQSEQKAIQGAEESLQAELSKIGAEMSALTSRSPQSTSTPRSLFNLELTHLSSQITALELKLAETLTGLKNSNEATRQDVDTSMTISEKKAKKLDELYREANAENEALYDKFNEELVKVLKSVRGGEGEEEMRRQLKEAQEERTRAVRENMRLKRENAGLRAQLRGE